jgi:hypothetical protein
MVKTDTLPARSIMNPEHPVHDTFVKFCNGKPLTLRKSQEFKRAYPKLFEFKIEEPTKVETP